MSLLHQSFLHFPGIGPHRAARLAECGIREWEDLLGLTVSDRLPFPAALLPALQETARENIEADRTGNLAFFIRSLNCGDRWRLLHDNWNRCTFLDIETSGLERASEITVISCWNGKEEKLFVSGENLEEFPDYILSVPLLVTFNGATFDLPVICGYFNLPEIPVPHVDMRWVCHRCELDGGLKAIERQLGLTRPDDLTETNGQEAIELWSRWSQDGIAEARTKLLRYCAADTIALQHVAAAVLSAQSENRQAFRLSPQDHWQYLNRLLPPAAMAAPGPSTAPSASRNAPPATQAQDEPPEDSRRLSALQQRLKAFLNTRKGQR